MTTRPVPMMIFCFVAALAPVLTPAFAMEPQAAAPRKSIERSFRFVDIPATTADSVTLSTFTFKASIGGTMVVDARGYCNLYTHASSPNTVLISIRQSSQTAWDPARVYGWGVAGIPPGTGAVRQMGWSAHFSAAVSAGQTRTVLVEATHQDLPTGAADCTGTVSMEIR